VERAGGAKGIGLACASCLGHEGCRVVIADVDDEAAAKCAGGPAHRPHAPDALNTGARAAHPAVPREARAACASLLVAAPTPLQRAQRAAEARWAGHRAVQQLALEGVAAAAAHCDVSKKAEVDQLIRFATEEVPRMQPS